MRQDNTNQASEGAFRGSTSSKLTTPVLSQNIGDNEMGDSNLSRSQKDVVVELLNEVRGLCAEIKTLSGKIKLLARNVATLDSTLGGNRDSARQSGT